MQKTEPENAFSVHALRKSAFKRDVQCFWETGVANLKAEETCHDPHPLDLEGHTEDILLN